MTEPTPELRRALDELPVDHPARALVKLALEDGEPVVFAAVIRRLLREVRA